MPPDDLKKRTKEFGLRVIRLVEALPKTQTFTVAKQRFCVIARSLGRSNLKFSQQRDCHARLCLARNDIKWPIKITARKNK